MREHEHVHEGGGGDPACWLSIVCTECGAVLEGEVCDRCGTRRTEERECTPA